MRMKKEECRMKKFKSSIGTCSCALHPTFIVRTRIGPEGLVKPVASELVKMDPWLCESEVLTLGQVMIGLPTSAPSCIC